MCVCVSSVKCEEIVVVRPVNRRAGVLADVDTDNPTVFDELAGLNISHEIVDTQIVETKAVDECIVRR